MITLPKKPKIIEENKNQASFEIEACYPGYGITLGNAFRRVLLSSLPGAAITGVKIKGVQHEFSTIPYVLEDIVQIILNLKQIRFKLNVDYNTDRVFKAELKAKGDKKVTAEDIKTSSDFEVVNKNIHIATLTNKKSNLEMEIDVESGLGYSPVEQRSKGKIEIGKIGVDAMFGPVRRVNYSVENMRVGERTDYGLLKINIETDGTITPRNAFLKAAQILLDHYKIFILLKEGPSRKKTASVKKSEIKAKKNDKVKKVSKKKIGEEDVTKIKIEDLKISSRIAAALIQAGVKTVAGLIRKKEGDLKSIEGLGDKAVVEIKRAIGKFGLTLKS